MYEVSNQEGNDSFEYRPHWNIGHSLDYKEIQPDRRGNQANFRDTNNKDAEPYGIDPVLLYQREEYWHGQ